MVSEPDIGHCASEDGGSKGVNCEIPHRWLERKPLLNRCVEQYMLAVDLNRYISKSLNTCMHAHVNSGLRLRVTTINIMALTRRFHE